MAAFRSLLSPMGLEIIRQLKAQQKNGGAVNYLEMPDGWTWKKLGPRRYGVFYKDKPRGECSRQERIADYVHRLIKCDVNDVTIRKTEDGKHVMSIGGKIVFRGTSPKHCWCWLAKMPDLK